MCSYSLSGDGKPITTLCNSTLNPDDALGASNMDNAQTHLNQDLTKV